MAASVASAVTQFEFDVRTGLEREQKQIPPQYFYDELGSALFEAITMLPEYGLTRADERLLEQYAPEITRITKASDVAELGSGSGRKTRKILKALRAAAVKIRYFPMDVSLAALEWCEKELWEIAAVTPICDDWEQGLYRVGELRESDSPLLLLFLGSSIGNLERHSIVDFLRSLKAGLRPGDFLLIGADLVKDRKLMIDAYNDSTGVTAAFNLNLLARINRELGANFDLRSFDHEIRWNDSERRIEMHLVSSQDQQVEISSMGLRFEFKTGESIWTESSHKFSAAEIESYGNSAGFSCVGTWTDREWPFSETLLTY